MKTTSLTVLFLCCMSMLVAQSVSISSEPAPVEYYRMPDYPLPSGYTTYSADLEIPFTELAKSGFTESYLVDTYLNLQGYKRVNNNPDVEITGTIGEFFIWSEIHNTNRTKTKDKEGNERIKYTYNMEVKYSLPMGIQVEDKESKRWLDKYIYSMSDTRSWISPSYNTLSDLDSYWRFERVTRLSNLQKDLMKEGLNKISDLINDYYGFKLINDKIRFASLGKKNHPDYDKFQKNVEIMQDAFALMDADKGLDAVATKAAPALAFYAETAEKYNTGNKDQKKLKHVCLYNQALAYFWLEDFDKAESFAKSIQRFDTKNKDVRRLLDEIEYTRASLYNAGRASRHQVVVGGKT
jgi:hypothetical protein